MATSFLQSDEVQNILIVVTEKNTSQQRVMDSNSAILSDGAASCLVHTNGIGQYKVIKITQNAEHSMGGGQGDPSSMVALAIEGFQTVFESFIHQCQIEAKDFVQFIPNNYNTSLLTMYSDISQIDFDKFFTKNLKLKAHVYSSDNLINLLDYSKIISPLLGEKIVLLSNGPSNWGFSALEVSSDKVFISENVS